MGKIVASMVLTIFIQGCSDSKVSSCINNIPMIEKSLANSPSDFSYFDVVAEIQGDNLYEINGNVFTQSEFKELLSNCSGKNTKIMVLNTEGYQTAYFINLLSLLNEKKFEVVGLVQ